MHLNRSIALAALAAFALLSASFVASSTNAQDGAPPAQSPAGETPAQAKPVTPKVPKAGEASKSKEVVPVADIEYAVFHTNQGDIVIELNRLKAPVSVENFTDYIKSGFFDGTVFHRVVPGFVIQGGGFTPKGDQKKTKPSISNEWENGLKNKRGTLSMARTTDPNSATSQFFVSLKDNDMLDQPISGGAGYAVFGKVIAGMDVVDSIARTERGVKNGMKDWPTSDMLVTTCEMLTKEQADKLTAAAATGGAADPKPAGAVAPVAPKAK
jgi:cyclophilin family peptidyl-prolyl cis-trans isomerase